MASDSQPKHERDDLLTPELAKTELAPSKEAETRTGPRPVGANVPSNSPPPRMVGRFRIDAQLGAGGMGDVFRAYDPVLDRAVALKVLRTERSADDRQRMRRVVREARAAAALTHPNTVTIFEVGEADREVFIAMELLEGEDLRSVIERGDASTADKLRWLLEAARALAVAHERGLVHRDVKPENMFVCKGGTLKLLDFGIAKRDDDDAATPGPAVDVGPSSLRTTEGRRIGTPRYMAPEQHAGDATDPRTDEYAWGLVAFELVAGSHVVADLRTHTTDGESTSPVPTLAAQRLDVLRAGARDVAEPVLLAITRALESRKEERFPSMAPIIEALESKAEPKPESKPETAAERESPAPGKPAAEALPPRAKTRSWLALPVIGAVVACGLVGLRAATHATSPTSATERSAAAAPPLRVTASRPLAVGPNDRVAIGVDGAAIVARDIFDALSLQHETPDGMVPLPRNMFLDALAKTHRALALRGVTYEGKPAMLVELDQDERGTFVGLFDATSTVSQRIFGVVNGLTAVSFGDEVIVVATTPANAPPRLHDLPNGVEAYALGRAPGVRRAGIEEGGAAAPSAAVLRDRLGVAYVLQDEIHFAVLDESLRRVGDVRTVAHKTSVPALAFAPDDAPVVFWVDDAERKTRLHSSALGLANPGNKADPAISAFSAPRVAVDEPLASRAPVTARLPDGTWVVAWVASSGGPVTLRVAPVGLGGVLGRALDVATGGRIDGVRATATGRGIDLWWYESDSLVRIAEIALAGSNSASMSRP